MNINFLNDAQKDELYNHLIFISDVDLTKEFEIEYDLEELIEKYPMETKIWIQNHYSD